MKIYNNNITYDFCPIACIKCKHYFGLGVCSLHNYLGYYHNKRMHPTKMLNVFEL